MVLVHKAMAVTHSHPHSHKTEEREDWHVDSAGVRYGEHSSLPCSKHLKDDATWEHDYTHIHRGINEIFHPETGMAMHVQKKKEEEPPPSEDELAAEGGEEGEVSSSETSDYTPRRRRSSL